MLLIALILFIIGIFVARRPLWLIAAVLAVVWLVLTLVATAGPIHGYY